MSSTDLPGYTIMNTVSKFQLANIIVQTLNKITKQNQTYLIKQFYYYKQKIKESDLSYFSPSSISLTAQLSGLALHFGPVSVVFCLGSTCLLSFDQLQYLFTSPKK